MIDNNPAVSIISLNVTGLNATIKGQKLLGWIKKKRVSNLKYMSSMINSL